nr:MAG TPA_asm: hypothetical protein [Caudoviricetes sp.]
MTSSFFYIRIKLTILQAKYLIVFIIKNLEFFR